VFAIAILDHGTCEEKAARKLEEQRRTVIVDVERHFGPAALAGERDTVGQRLRRPEERPDRGSQPAERQDQRNAARRSGCRGWARTEPEAQGEQDRRERAHEAGHRPKTSATEVRRPGG